MGFRRTLSSMLPSEMEARAFTLSGSQDVGELSAQGSDPSPHDHNQAHSSRGMERRSVGNLRNVWRPSASLPNTVRVVTPEPPDAARDSDASGAGAEFPSFVGSLSSQSSPRLIPAARSGAGGAGGLPGGGSNNNTNRRQGIVFNEAFPDRFDGASSSPPSRAPPIRPRTHTMDGALRQQIAPAAETRHRVGSFSSSGSTPANDDSRSQPSQLHSHLDVYRATDFPAPTSAPAREKKSSSTRSRLIKRTSSRPTSPLISLPPSVDSLPLPIPTDDANRVLLLMRTLCGQMRGDVWYQNEPGGTWHFGTCYIEGEKGSLMFDASDNGPFRLPIVSDLRGCRVRPVDRPDGDGQCLEIASLQSGFDILLQPSVAEELDLWLAAFLCWQQLRFTGFKLPDGRAGNSTPPGRAEMKRRASAVGVKDGAIIKVGKVMLWDKGPATSPKAIIKRPSTRDLRTPGTRWRRVSCILQDNGEFKLMTENDVSVISVIELSQLARSAVQQLDRSVLDEDYCIAIFPSYASTSTQLSIFRPVYISLDSRVLFEVWYVLLRAFAYPDMYTLGPANEDQVYEVTDFDSEPPGEVFRAEKTISVRISEARIQSYILGPDGGPHERYGRGDQQGAGVGNYLAEVILDGEVRARTTTQTDTKLPAWREDCKFSDLPPTVPYLSVVLKRVDGNLESLNHLLQASQGLPKSGNLTEVLCGSVDISLNQLERGKDHEQWFPIYDDSQQSIGTMLLKVNHDELVVLTSREYQNLSELLHAFNSGLTAQIAEALPGYLRRVAELLLNIFQVSGNATEWLMNLVEDEIDGLANQSAAKKARFSRRLKSNESADSAGDRKRDMSRSLQGEANLLFRGNSLLTQALELHMRRLGKEYLEEVLGDKIFEINEINPNCEVDPARLQQGEDMQQHWDQLIHLTTEVWECIMGSVPRLPPELRHVLKYIRSTAENRYGGFLRTVMYTSVSGFLFLRFICPAILNPKLFGLLRNHPRPRAQRTLTLVAKGLQALANLSTIGKKEPWMGPMNRFLGTQRQPFKDFLDLVCAIPTERTNVILPASYSTPITILGRLSPLAREGFPSLPYLIDHARNFAALVKLWTDANSAATNEAQVYEGELLSFHVLCVDLQERADRCFAHMESVRLAEAASQSTEDPPTLSDAMDHMSLGDMTPNASLYSYGKMSSNSTTTWLEQEPRPTRSPFSDVDSSMSGKESRFSGRDLNSLRQVSGSSELSAGGTIRTLRNATHARKFLSGFMRKRNQSPEAGATSSPSPVRETTGGHDYWNRDRDRDRDYDRDQTRDKDKGRDKDARGRMSPSTDPRRGDMSTRY